MTAVKNWTHEIGLTKIGTVGTGGFGKVISASVPGMKETRAVKEVERIGNKDKGF